MVLDRAIRYGNDNGTSVYDSCGLQLVDYKKFLHYSAFTRFFLSIYAIKIAQEV